MKNIIFILLLSYLAYVNKRWNIDLFDLFIYAWCWIERWCK